MHVMCDLETLGTRTSSVILSIGAVWFDPHTQDLFEEFDVVLNIDEQRALGRTQDESTLRWWNEQSSEAKMRVFNDGNAMPVTPTLDAFDKFLGLHMCEGLWGNGAGFDNVLLRSLYMTYGRAGFPKSYSLDRCYRTLRAIRGGTVAEPARAGVHHNALDDAKHQAHYAMLMLR